MANWPLVRATEPRAPTPAPLPPLAQGLSPNLGSFFPGGKTVLRLKARALTSCCRESSARSQPQPGGWEGCLAPARTAGTCWLFTKWHLGLWKIQFHSSVPSPGKINKTFISFGDFAKVNGEFNVNFQVWWLLYARPPTSTTVVAGMQLRASGANLDLSTWEGVPVTCLGRHRNLQLKLPSEAECVGSSDPAHTGWENMT